MPTWQLVSRLADITFRSSSPSDESTQLNTSSTWWRGWRFGCLARGTAAGRPRRPRAAPARARPAMRRSSLPSVSSDHELMHGLERRRRRRLDELDGGHRGGAGGARDLTGVEMRWSPFWFATSEVSQLPTVPLPLLPVSSMCCELAVSRDQGDVAGLLTQRAGRRAGHREVTCGVARAHVDAAHPRRATAAVHSALA